jgi:hypothetical protein
VIAAIASSGETMRKIRPADHSIQAVGSGPWRYVKTKKSESTAQIATR